MKKNSIFLIIMSGFLIFFIGRSESCIRKMGMLILSGIMTFTSSICNHSATPITYLAELVDLNLVMTFFPIM